MWHYYVWHLACSSFWQIAFAFLSKEFQKSGFLTIQILDFVLSEGMKVSKIFLYIAKALNWMEICGFRFFLNPDFFPGSPNKKANFLIRCLIRSERLSRYVIQRLWRSLMKWKPRDKTQMVDLWDHAANSQLSKMS